MREVGATFAIKVTAVTTVSNIDHSNDSNQIATATNFRACIKYC